MEAIENRDLELGSLIATPISRAMMYILASKGVKKPEREIDSINPFSKALEIAEAKQQFSTEFARTFTELLKEGKVPAWVASMLDLEKITLVAKG